MSVSGLEAEEKVLPGYVHVQKEDRNNVGALKERQKIIVYAQRGEKPACLMVGTPNEEK